MRRALVGPDVVSGQCVDVALPVTAPVDVRPPRPVFPLLPHPELAGTPRAVDADLNVGSLVRGEDDRGHTAEATTRSRHRRTAHGLGFRGRFAWRLPRAPWRGNARCNGHRPHHAMTSNGARNRPQIRYVGPMSFTPGARLYPFSPLAVTPSWVCASESPRHRRTRHRIREGATTCRGKRQLHREPPTDQLRGRFFSRRVQRGGWGGRAGAGPTTEVGGWAFDPLSGRKVGRG